MSTMNRRDFLKTATVAGAGLIIGFWLPGSQRRALAAAPDVAPNAFIRIAPDDTVTILSKHLEFGQGVFTSLAMIAAEELDCDWRKVRVEHSPTAPEYVHTAFGIQITGGSTSVANSWEQLRRAGAQARAMLVAAAAQEWNVPATACKVRNGVITHGNRKATFGQLAEKAARQPAPASVTLKKPAEYTLIGKPTRRIEAASKANGSAQFGVDVLLPNMAVALVARSPVFGGKLASFDATKAKAIPGVIAIETIPSGVAVIANGYWAARQARDALVTRWDEGRNAQLSTAKQREQYRALAERPGMPAKLQGSSDAWRDARTVEAVYEFPYLAHAPMEPLNCVVDLTAERCKLWIGSQFQTLDRVAAAKTAGLKPEQVELITVLAGGGFGRRANPVSDYVVEAVEVAKVAKRPVKVMWTREDDIQGGYCRPMFVHKVRAAVDAQGRVAGWQHVAVGQSIAAGTPFQSGMVKDGVDMLSVEGIADTHYAIPNLDVSLHTAPADVPVLWWRSVGHSHSAYVMETMMDELAALAKADPLAFRRAHLAKSPRHLAVIDLLNAKSGWGRTLPKGRAMGVAVHESFNSVVGLTAEVSLVDGKPRVHKVVCAVHCGQVVNPLGAERQVRSAVVFGLSAALHQQITFDQGRVQQSNFGDYAPLRMSEMPVVEAYFVPSTDAPTGLGEPATPVIAPAVANALARLTGRRVRALPMGANAVTA